MDLHSSGSFNPTSVGTRCVFSPTFCLERYVSDVELFGSFGIADRETEM